MSLLSQLLLIARRWAAMTVSLRRIRQRSQAFGSVACRRAFPASHWLFAGSGLSELRYMLLKVRSLNHWSLLRPSHPNEADDRLRFRVDLERLAHRWMLGEATRRPLTAITFRGRSQQDQEILEA